MLTEIYCEEFKTGGKNGTTRPPIELKKGLNIVEGDDNGSNSIGKSTFLMAIDFCFGGNDYVDVLKDVIDNVKHHTIFFSYKFDKDYHFARKTDEKDFVYICNEPRIISDNKISLDDFNKFLFEKYEINLPYITFRGIISRFMRIYNRQNLNELLPLRSHDNETEKNSITEMLKLYNLYESIKEFARLSDEASEKDSTFGKAQEYQFLPKITATDFEKNQKRINELKLQAEALADKSDRGLLSIPAEKAEQITKIKDQITALKRNRSRYYNQLNSFKRDEEYEIGGLKNNFSDLTEFFENVKLDNLLIVEQFHKEITSILKNEVKKSIKDCWDNINALNDAITQLENEVDELQQTTNVSKVILKSYSTLEREIEQLELINKYYTTKKDLHKDAKEKEANLIKQTAVQIASLISTINTKMAEINKEYYLNETSSPILATPTTKTYTFETPNDNGTGCRYKGMITLDTSVLQSSKLPTLAHDSVMFVQMSYSRVERTLKLYNDINDKQIFIAVDRTTNLNEESKKIINNHRRLLLSPNGNELFGWYWGKERMEEEKNGEL